VFKENLRAIMTDLAKMIVRDGEGATKLVEVNVSGAKTQKEARKAAEAIAGSLLTKCAVHGGDPNWGRVASSVGSSGIKLDPDRMDITLDGVAFLKKGKFTSPAAKMVRKVFKKKNVLIEVDLNRGKSGAVVYTCDISKKYVAINSYYTT